MTIHIHKKDVGYELIFVRATDEHVFRLYNRDARSEKEMLEYSREFLKEVGWKESDIPWRKGY